MELVQVSFANTECWATVTGTMLGERTDVTQPNAIQSRWLKTPS